MNLVLREALVDAITANSAAKLVTEDIDFDPEDGQGFIRYASTGTWVDPSAPGFSGYRTAITDEELVRAYLLTRLVSTYHYPASPQTVEIERVYKPVGRPTGKGGRIDVLVRDMPAANATKPTPGFLFIECKAPDKFDADLRMIDGQLFRLSRQEAVHPKYLVYYTVELKLQGLRERLILIDTDAFPDYSAWDAAGQPITDAIPAAYGRATKLRYANVLSADERYQPLDTAATEQTFSRLRTEIHDVIWGGGGTNNNEVFVLNPAYPLQNL